MQRQQEFNLRNQYIQNLNDYLSSARTVLADTLQKLNWTESATSKNNEKPLITCPLNPDHRLTRDNLDKHLEMCRWHRQGYRDEDIPFPPAPAHKPVSTVVIDKTLQRDIILNAAQRDPKIRIAVLITLQAV